MSHYFAGMCYVSMKKLSLYILENDILYYCDFAVMPYYMYFTKYKLQRFISICTSMASFDI